MPQPNRLLSTTGGNREMNQSYTTSQVPNIARKTKFSHISHYVTVRKALYSKIIPIIDNFVGHTNWIDTCDDRIQLYWKCTNSTLPFIVLESIWPQPISL